MASKNMKPPNNERVSKPHPTKSTGEGLYVLSLMAVTAIVVKSVSCYSELMKANNVRAQKNPHSAGLLHTGLSRYNDVTEVPSKASGEFVKHIFISKIFPWLF